MGNREIKIFRDVDEINEFAAAQFVEIAKKSIFERGIFTVSLSGGSTPKKLYELLATERFSSQIDWKKVHVFWGDERGVPIDSSESNFKMASDALLSKVEIPAENVHRFLTENTEPKVIAKKMESEIRDFFKLSEGEFPAFDLVLLGMGGDGHTASLFPGTIALNETKRIVTENYVEKFQTFRLTLTIPTINNARKILFLIAGEEKVEALQEVLEGARNPTKFPSQFIKPENGELLFLVAENAVRV